MAMHLGFLIVLTGLTGIHSITTVREVSVKAGGSISIPCLYDPYYINHVKYLCKGYFWKSCSDAVRTDQQSSGKFSISDDKNRRIFTVTINDLTGEDTDYWCAVKVNGGSDKGAYFHLSVTSGTPSLHVDHQEIRAFIGDNITISCYFHNLEEMQWCRLGGSCVKRSSESIDGTTVTINARKSVFTVTMSGLKTESSGWYWCVMGGLQMPVYVTVKQPTTCKYYK
ncbi:Polymeric immunoglobulin receptor [Collichthys lucidus]|nr:Polymeric immunoglobulin receptor [Collichthys lucidus]